MWAQSTQPLGVIKSATLLAICRGRLRSNCSARRMAESAALLVDERKAAQTGAVTLIQRFGWAGTPLGRHSGCTESQSDRGPVQFHMLFLGGHSGMGCMSNVLTVR